MTKQRKQAAALAASFKRLTAAEAPAGGPAHMVPVYLDARLLAAAAWLHKAQAAVNMDGDAAAVAVDLADPQDRRAGGDWLRLLVHNAMEDNYARLTWGKHPIFFEDEPEKLPF